MLYPFYPYLCEKVTKILWKPSAAAPAASSLSPVSTMPRESTPSLPLTIRSMAWPTISWPWETHGFCVGQRQKNCEEFGNCLAEVGMFDLSHNRNVVRVVAVVNSIINHSQMVGFSLALATSPLNLLGKRWARGRSHVDGGEFAGRGRLVLFPPLSCEVGVESRKVIGRILPVWRSLPGLVNVNITMERSTMLLIGKSTISIAHNSPRVCLPEGTVKNVKNISAELPSPIIPVIPYGCRRSADPMRSSLPRLPSCVSIRPSFRKSRSTSSCVQILQAAAQSKMPRCSMYGRFTLW